MGSNYNEYATTVERDVSPFQNVQTGSRHLPPPPQPPYSINTLAFFFHGLKLKPLEVSH